MRCTPPVVIVPRVEVLESRRLLAATYYVSAAGNDNANGLSPTSAWRSIDRVNKVDFNPGDKVLFEGGKTFGVTGATGAELLANGGFEAGLTGWADTFGTAAGNGAASTTAPLAGASSLKLSGSGAAIRAQDVTAAVAPGQSYTMGFWSRVTTIGPGERRVGITFYSGGQQVGTFYRGTAATDWTQARFAFVAPPQFDRAVVWASRKGDNSSLYVDDVSLRSIPNGLVFDQNDSGAVANTVIVASYGKGKATIDARDGIGLWGGNVSQFQVQNLIFTGSWNSVTGTGENTGVGIEYVNTATDNSKLEFVTAEKVETKGFRWAGIRVGGWAAKSGFRTVMITDSLAHHNGDAGIHIRGEFDRASTLYANEKVYVARSKAYDNGGIPRKFSNSGNGILMSDVNMGTVERSVAHHNGALSDYAGGGPVGIWAFDANKVTLQYSESFANKTKSNRDGAGFDLDGGVTNSVIQNNYSHDNDGAGYLLGQFSSARAWGRNFVRYNISQNDARRNNYGAITLTGNPGPYNVAIEHNVVYMTPPASGAASAVRVKNAGTGVVFRNNVFQTTGGVQLIEADSAGALAAFNGNVYWSGGASSKFKWTGKTYNSLVEWRSATGREISNANPTGLFTDPLLAAPGTASHLNDAYKLTTLTQYKPLPGSPLLNGGFALTAPFTKYEPATYDFFVRKLPDAARDIGVSEEV